jgi:site-specific DNA-methyltransferase (cytosine-N4-specific)
VAADLGAVVSAPYYADESVTLWHGDALTVLREMPDQSIACCVTSPPYFGLRDYGVEGQYGLEASPAEYVETMRALFAEVRRVLADDGTLWLNLGDSYYSGRGAPTQPDVKNPARRPGVRSLDKGGADWAKPKDLLGIPWRTAFALQDDGWILRNDVIWSKPNAMPESVTDRLSTRHEHLFMLTKSPRYWFDLDPIREAVAYPSVAAFSAASAHDPQSPSQPSPSSSEAPHSEQRSSDGIDELYRPDPTPYAGQPPQRGRARTGKRRTYAGSELGRNPGDVWTVATQPFSEAHFAVMPQALAERAILAGCKPGGTVLDPFSGSGTTGLAATKHGHRYVGIDLSADYLDLSLRTRFAQPGLDLAGGVA